jgi:hypothetical protein
VGSAFAIWFGYIGLFMEYARTRPRNPQPENGRTYSINNHGTVAYLNRSESVRLWIIGFSYRSVRFGNRIGPMASVKLTHSPEQIDQALILQPTTLFC